MICVQITLKEEWFLLKLWNVIWMYKEYFIVDFLKVLRIMVLEYMVTVWDTAEPKTYCHDNVKVKLVFWFDLILYVQSTIFQLYWDGSSWVEPVLS